MRMYSRDEEERVRAQAQVRAWTRSGLLAAPQGAVLEADLQTDLKRTNLVLRLVQALFTTMIVGAAVGLSFLLLEIQGEKTGAATIAFAGAACWLLAEVLVRKTRVYRYGVEEALAMCGAALLSVGVTLMVFPDRPGGSAAVMVGLALGAVTGAWVYWRFGLVYAAMAAMVCAAAIPFQLHVQPSLQRTLSSLGLAVAFAIARAVYKRTGDDYPGDEWAVLQAAAWAGAYLTVNLQLATITGWAFTTPVDERWFYWTTYLVIWLMPAVGIALAIRDKDRVLLAVNLAMALVTLATNKPYLGWPRQTWDPMLLGALLMGGATGLRRWLSRGPGGQRAGFTAVNLLEADRDAIRVMGTASAGLPTPATASTPMQPAGTFDGGRSGGAGGGASF